jgi:hypothetical protein
VPFTAIVGHLRIIRYSGFIESYPQAHIAAEVASAGMAGLPLLVDASQAASQLGSRQLDDGNTSRFGGIFPGGSHAVGLRRIDTGARRAAAKSSSVRPLSGRDSPAITSGRILHSLVTQS